MKNKIKIKRNIAFAISILALVFGASFHGYRIHPENVEKYNFGVLMGIIMIILFIIFLLIACGLQIYSKKKNKNID